MNISKNYYDNDVNKLGDNNDPSDTPSILRNLKPKNINRLVLGHLNINSLSEKFDQLKALIKRNIDILVSAETLKLTLVFLMLNLELMVFQSLLDLIVIRLVEEF